MNFEVLMPASLSEFLSGKQATRMCMTPNNILYSLIVLLWLGGIGNAQGQGYTVSQSGPYNIEIDNPTFIGVNQDDATEIPIGFDFAFYGTTYSNCWVGGDGFISFGAYPGGGCCGQMIPDNTAPDNLIAVGWTNVDMISAHFEIFGTTPYRRLVITYDLRNPCDSVFYGQVKLFETSNVIEIHTQEWQGGECQGWLTTQGVENAGGTQAVAVPGRNNNDVWAVHPGDNDFVSFTPTVPSPTYVLQEDDPDYNIEFFPPTDVTITEDSFIKVPIAFSFEFFGIPYDSLHIGFNGFLSFSEPLNGGCCDGGQMMPDPFSINNFIAPAWTDVSTNFNGYNIYSYGVIGDYPNRKMIIHFNYSDACYNAYYEGQVKLFEGSNIIEIHTSQWANSGQPCINTSQGIEDIVGQSAYFLPERNANTDWSVPCCGDLVRFIPTASLPQADAGVNQIFTGPFCEGSQMMGCLISNFGGQLIDSVQVNWTWNGVLQDSIMFTQDIPVTGVNYLVNLGNQTLTLGDTFELKAWTSLPNGLPDDNPVNDTLVALIQVGQHGLFTIGGVDPDFTSFNTALDSLAATGICDSVIFHVRPGTYTEHVSIPSISGSISYPILFTAENGDSSSVILSYGAMSSDSNYVLQLNGARHVTWEKMTLTATGENYGRVIDIKSLSTDNTIRHCRINGVETTSTSHDYACIISRSLNANLTIESNTTTNGSYAFYHENLPEGPIFLNGSLTYTRGGGGNGSKITGLKLQHNTFQQFGYRGIRTINSSAMLIQNNVISSDKNNVWGIQSHTDDDTLQIRLNHIYLPSGNYGLHLTDINPLSGGRADLSNNMISVPKSSGAIVGIGLNNCQKTNVYHNSVLVNNPNTSTYAFYLGGGALDSVYNNVFSNSGNGHVILIGNVLTHNLDYNDYYFTGNTLGVYNNTIPDLATWQEVTGFDMHSITANPHFTSSIDLHAIGSFLNRAGSGILTSPTDIDGDIRSMTSPDLGADEFVPVSLDVAITALLSPTLTCEEEQAIKIVVTNLGTDTIDHFTIEWNLNGLAQTDLLVTQSLNPEGDTVQVSLSSYVFGNQSDSIQIWTTLPNDSTDQQPDNDTLSFHFRLPLNGTYTIGGSSPDFSTIGEAVVTLNEFHTCGPVVFRIRDGIYEEQIIIDSIPTTSAINTITFESESGDSSAVTIQYTPPSTTLPWVILLDGTDYVTFRHLGIKSLPAYYCDALELRHNARYITLTHCKLEGYNFTSGSSILFKSLAFGGINDHLTITHNCFVNGHYGVYLYNYGTIDEVYIDDNQFINQRYGAMDLPFMSNLFIRRNTISSNSSNAYKGIDLSSSAQTTDVSGNIINLPNQADGMFLNSMNYGSAIGTAQVYNNMVQSTGNGNGIRIWNSENTLIAYNSCNMSGGGYAFELTGGDSVTIHNNIFVSNSGRAFSSFSFTPTVICDYNDLYSVSGNLGFWHDTLYATFEEWQTGTHFDSNSFSLSPEFVSPTDLHILADTLDGSGIPIPGIAMDIDGNPRNAMMPDIGADEIGANDDDAGVFALLPEMPFARGSQDVKAVIRNFGGNTITQLDIHWQLNQVDQPVFNYTGALPSLQQDTIVLGNVTFTLNTPYSFKSWTSEPNGNPDLYTINDTLWASNRYAAVSDTITIGGTSPDLSTVTDAINAMSLGGILDSVHFQIRNGTYHQIVQIPQASGMNCAKPIVFESESGNPANVVWDNQGLNNHTVILDGADGVWFKNLTIKSVVQNYHALVLGNQAQCNTIADCILEGVTTTNTSTANATIYSYGALNNNNTIAGNTIKKGSQGIFWHGNYNSTGLQILGNTLENAYTTGCSINACEAPVLSQNVISTNSQYNYLYGIECNSCTQNTKIDGNQVLFESKRGVGIILVYCNGTAAHPVQISNNFILIGQNNSSYGIFQHYSNYCNTNYNTVRLTSGDLNSFCYYRSYGTHTHLANNLFDNRTQGPVIVFGGNEGPLTCDYNDLLGAGPNLVSYNGVSYSDLEAWQVTNFDTSSVSVDPMYASSNGYSITSASLNSAGTPISGISLDIDGDPRDTLTPDIGCDEFFLANDDVGILSINYPVEPFPAGVNTIFIKFINNGQDTLTTMQVDWEVDSVAQPTYYWTGLLPSAGIYDSLDIGEFNFAPYQYHSIKVWVSAPNGMADELALNDTLDVSQLYPGLSGTYTIGGNSPDFDSISQAVQALNQGGAAGPVTLNIRTGTYLETINLNDYPGSDCNRPVIFKSENGDSTSVIISNLGINDNVVTLNGTDGVIFENLTLTSVHPVYRNVINYTNGAHCNQFLHNQIIGYEGTSTNTDDGVIVSSSTLDTANQFIQNRIVGGSMAFYLSGPGAPSGTLIQNNQLISNYYHGIYASGESGMDIQGNTIIGGTYNYYRGIYMEYCSGPNFIERNKIQCVNADNVIRLEGCPGTNTTRSRINSNFLSAGGSTGCNGLLVNNTQYLDIWHNNIHLYSTAGSTALYFHTDVSLHIADNIISNTGMGQALFGANQTSMVSDYNDIYSTDAFGTWNGMAMADLLAWQTATGGDAHSKDVNPQFMSSSNLHISNILLNGTGQYFAAAGMDIDGQSRNNPPDIGADEFDPSIANDAGVFMFVGPNAPFAQGVQPITIALKNYGYDTLESADIRWLVNGMEQPVFHWTGSLPSAQCDTIVIGNYTFAPYTGHHFILWSESPNGIPDSTHVNDTLAIADLFPALSGTYTVGGVLPDFNLFSQLQEALNKGGILGDVTFNIRNGTYSTQLVVENFPRNSYAHTVTFQAESGDSSLVHIRKDFYLPSKNYTIQLRNAHHVYFEHLSLESTQGRILDMVNGSSNIHIESCALNGVPITYVTGTHQLIYSSTTSEDSIHIVGNRFAFGDYGIFLTASGGDHEKEVTIENNSFQDIRYRSIEVQNQTRLMIKKNLIIGTQYAHDAICVTASSNTREISFNDIRLSAGGQYGLYLNSVSGTSGQWARIYNNYIYIHNYSGNANGIHQEYGQYIQFYYNTVRLENCWSDSRCFYDYQSNQYIDLYNCVFANYCGGYTLYVQWYPGSSHVMNYCDLYSSGPAFAAYGQSYANLAALQAGTMQNLNGVSAEPLFSDEGPQLHQAACDGAGISIAGITTDIQGQSRNPTTPDIGCDEFTLPAHDVGAKLLVHPHTYCGLTSAEPVTIRIQNYGLSTETGFDVAYSMNGSAWSDENIGGLNISPGGTGDYTFTTTEDLSSPGNYSFALRTALSGDLDHANDTLWNIEVEHIPALTQPVSSMLPSNNSINLDIPVSLSWAPAPNATKYDVYIWASNLSQPGTPTIPDLESINTSYASLEYGQSYSWKVVAKNVCGQTQASSVLQFMTRELPDLIVDSISAPLMAVSEQQIQIEWQVKNTGSGSTQSILWTDAVYLSLDATLNTTFDTYLGGVQNLTSLQPDESYMQTGTFTIPQGFTGLYYVFVYSDRYNAIAESANTNNWSRGPLQMEITLLPPPDLVIDQVVTPATAFSGTTITVQYTGRNNGTGSIGNVSWKDRIKISDDGSSSAGGTVLTSLTINGPLAVDATYSRTVSVNIPNAIFGEYYIYVESDILNQVYEHAAENNNSGRSDTMSIILTPPANLVVTNLNVQDTLHSNGNTSFAWTVENQGGSSPAEPYWYDALYISPSPVYNINFLTQILTAVKYSPLNPGTTYTQNLTSRVPIMNEGSYYLYAFTDRYNYVFEHTFENDNITRFGPYTLVNPDISPSPDSLPLTAQSGDMIPIHWQLVNHGPGHMYDRALKYRYYLSTLPVFNPQNAILVNTTNTGNMTLLAGDTMFIETSLTIPLGLNDAYYLYIQVDPQGVMHEQNDAYANNLGRSINSIDIDPGPYPDLKTLSISIPDTATAGDDLPLLYTQINQGGADATGRGIEAVYISFSPTWDPSLSQLISEASYTLPLLKDSSITVSRSIVIPATTTSNVYYLYVVSDQTNTIFEYQGENNNILRSNPIFIHPYPPVDIAVMGIQVPEDTLQSGTVYEISYQIHNLEASPLRNFWRDAIYISTDSIFDPELDQLVSVFDVTTPGLDQNEIFPVSVNARIPDGTNGDYYIIVKTDIEDVNSDVNLENNINLFRSGNGQARLVHIQLSPYPDLIVSNISTSATAVAGQQLIVAYTIENLGDSTALSWQDRIYLSGDPLISNGDLLLYTGRINSPLMPLLSVSDTVTIALPGYLSGNYFLIIRTDYLNELYEHTGESNNQTTFVIQVTTPPPSDLIVDVIALPDSLLAGDPTTISWTTKNHGNFPAQGSVREIVYLSPDTLWSVEDPVFGFRQRAFYLPPQSSHADSILAPVVGVINQNYYALVRTDALSNINESNDTNNISASVDPAFVDVKTLYLDSLTTDSLHTGEQLYYKLNIDPGHSGDNILVTLEGDSIDAYNELFIRFNNAPTRADFDISNNKPLSGKQQAVISNAQVGTYYILSYGSTTGSTGQEVTLHARVLSYEILAVTPERGSNSGMVTVVIDGSRLDSTYAVRLHANDSTGFVLRADTFIIISPEKIIARFDLRGVEPGFYNVECQIEPYYIAVLQNGFEVFEGAEADLQVNWYLSPGGTSPRNKPVKIVVEMINNGDADVENRYIRIYSPYNNVLAWNYEELISGVTHPYLDIPVQLQNGFQGILPPGNSAMYEVFSWLQPYPFFILAVK